MIPFYGIILSAIWTILSWLLRTVVIKFVVFTLVYVLGLEVMKFAAGTLFNGVATPAQVLKSLEMFPKGTLYFMDLMRLLDGLKLIITTAISIWFIRRIPLVR